MCIHVYMHAYIYIDTRLERWRVGGQEPLWTEILPEKCRVAESKRASVGTLEEKQATRAKRLAADGL